MDHSCHQSQKMMGTMIQINFNEIKIDLLFDFISEHKNKRKQRRMVNTKEDIIKKITDEIPWVDIKPFSHNIISLQLTLLSEHYGQEEANKLIRNTKLIELGWSEEKD